VLMWVPDVPLTPDKPASFAYALSWDGDVTRPPGGRVVATRRDRGTVPNAYRFVIDFDGERLRSLPPDRAPKASVSAGPRPDAAEILDQHLVKHPVTGGWRLTFQVRPLIKDPIELRAYLADGDDVVTETWSYTLLP